MFIGVDLFLTFSRLQVQELQFCIQLMALGRFVSLIGFFSQNFWEKAQIQTEHSDTNHD